ncbi:hypothetical protein UCRPC4_g02591 [Phaeomoniella chlamydospora]|uniref:Uncharacterized protein n=1 Tax=Phaeomoniella chlamydospora TaxID=158046 RepID=A0A0G2H5Z3_PHACM|nr:hypothetical protein UCRPC4_g02591 [Phaeomoniella chlamydospora]
MSASPNRSPTRPLADLTSSQRNLLATPSLFTPSKGLAHEHDTYETTSSVKTTSKSNLTMTIHNDEIVESTYETSRETTSGNDNTQQHEYFDDQETDAGEGENYFDPVASSPFDNTVDMNFPTSSHDAPESPRSPSPVKGKQMEYATGEEEEDEDNIIHHETHEDAEGMSTIFHGADDHNPHDEPDITIDIGDLSTFSAVPNVDMTLFSGLRGSPTKTGGNWSPGKQLLLNTPGTARRQSPRRASFDDDDDDDATPRRPTSESTDLLNFTGQSNVFIPPPSVPRTSRRSPSGRGAFPVRVSPTKSQAQLERERAAPQSRPEALDSRSFVMETPSRRNNLLDLDIEPLPTPRSVPTITPRELESLRSDLTSQISALRATLSGKEAEVSALKKAITEAEVRCGTALEDVRNEKAKVEGLESDREAWRARQAEMEGILRDVKQEVLVRTRDAEKAERKVDEMDKKLGDWEGRNRELEAQVETLRRRVAAAAEAASSGPSGDGSVGDVTMRLMDVDSAVKDATERVARELHALYKGKHETKVAALKKSYEARWEKRVKELEGCLKESQEEVIALKTERDATISAPVMTHLSPEVEKEKERLREAAEHLEADKRMLEARIQGLESELSATQSESEDVRAELEKQRAENGELVAAVDVLLALQDELNTATTREQPNTSSKTSTTSTLQSNIDNLRGSIHRSAHPYSAQTVGTATPRSIHKYIQSPAKPRPTSLTSGLKLPQPSRGTGIPTSGASANASGESRIGKGPLSSRIGGGVRSGGLVEGIRMMGAGGSSR